MGYSDPERQKKAKHESYLRHKARYIEEQRQRRQTTEGRLAKREEDTARRRALVVYVNELKSHPCKDCGLSFPPCAMDFHHLRDKTAAIAVLVGRRVSRMRLDQEIAKCILLCAVCHRIKHSNEEPASDTTQGV